MGEQALNTYGLDTYLTLEAQGDTKYEYYDGFILAMAGGSLLHSELGNNVGTCLTNAIRAKGLPCKVYNSDLKVSIKSANSRFYPDVSIVCGQPVMDEKTPHAVQNPVVVVEVLSESTEARDRGTKFQAYRQLPSLREYILVSQEEALVEVFSLTDEGTWHIQTATKLDDSLKLHALDLSLKMEDVYFGVNFPAKSQEANPS